MRSAIVGMGARQSDCHDVGMSDCASDYISDPADRAIFARETAKLGLLGVCLEARHMQRDLIGRWPPGSAEQIRSVLRSTKILRTILAIEQTRRRVAARDAAGW
jgi:hypothetical protein